ncbi:fimbria/pilus outer membrane usher protein [Escherichia coli]|uniref:fimbria/pilus outer membrane usher protein n=1 Tax=Escherichia coli TaxID=562 RepID=UPI000B42789F|nr:fimbria/pilus outer membrane usher protein [Escherichia coli]EFJ7371578.1 fimbrial biogenesis outer membrane usher protein [Escherichia coli]OWC41997.1 usher protein [Escherichia coli]RCP65673.1 fimbrial biogenesis outer membrane usher protein [Escherichia coli]CAD5789300.1 CS12 fimbria outer membrane usher protein [Escherichia coli]CAD5791005.1 CS12 fimbria outer membrane usher protein [Escherichia coli]
MYRYTPVFVFFIITNISHASGIDYFDPSLLATDKESGEEIDLTVFSKAGGGIEGDREVSIYVNDSFYTRNSLYFVNGTTGSLEPIFNCGFFDNILLPQYRPVCDSNEITTNLFLSSVPYSKVDFDQGNSRVDVSIPQAYTATEIHMKSSPESWEHGIPAFLMDYRLSGNHNKIGDDLNYNLYANSSVGVNVDKWRLRSNLNYTSYRSNFKDRKNENEEHSIYNTYIERDIGNWRSTFRFGELYTDSLILDSISFVGAKLYSNDEMLNNKLRNYSPTIRGIAYTQAVVTVMQNNRIVLQSNVPPGPFELNDLYLSGYSGDLYIKINESDGQEHGFIQPYSILPEMKRKGVYGFELAAGYYNNRGMANYYDATPFIHGSWSKGLNAGITLYGETIQSEKYQSVGGGSSFSLGSFGALSGDVSLSIADKNDDVYTGQSYGFKYSKSKLDTGTTVTLATYRYSSKDFYTFDDFVYKNQSKYSKWDNRLKNRITLSLNQSLNNYGMLSLDASQQNYWNNSEVNQNLVLSYNFGWENIYFSTSFSLDQSKKMDGERENNKAFNFNVNIPFTSISENVLSNRGSIGYGMTKADNRVKNTASLTGYIDNTNLQYRLSKSWGNGNQSGHQAASLSWSNDFMQSSAGYTSSSNIRTIDYSLSGSLIAYPWQTAFGSSSVMNGAVIVETPGVSGVKIRQGGKTSFLGTAIVSTIQPYTENRIELDPNELRDDIVISDITKSVVPEKGSITRLKYNVYKGHQVVFKLQDEGGVKLPFGSVVTLSENGEEYTGIVDDNGRVYIAGVPKKGLLHASWGKGKSCKANFNIDEQIVSQNGAVIQISEVCK